jgi:hypothetical protein
MFSSLTRGGRRGRDWRRRRRRLVIKSWFKDKSMSFDMVDDTIIAFMYILGEEEEGRSALVR